MRYTDGCVCRNQIRKQIDETHVVASGVAAAESALECRLRNNI